MNINKALFIFTFLVSLQTQNIVANEEKCSQNELPEYMQYIPKEILIACKHRPIGACEVVLRSFFCAYKCSQGKLTEGEKQYCKQVKKDLQIYGYKNEEEHIAEMVMFILEGLTLPNKTSEIIDRTLASKRLMELRARHSK